MTLREKNMHLSVAELQVALFLDRTKETVDKARFVVSRKARCTAGIKKPPWMGRPCRR
jgi:hypothetical protein